MFCRNCGTQIREGARFCVKCGKPVPQTSAAPNHTVEITKESQPTQEAASQNPSQEQSNSESTVRKPVETPSTQTPPVQMSPTQTPPVQTSPPQTLPVQMNRPAKKKSSAGLIIAIVVLVIFILGVAGATLYVTVINPEVLEEFFDKNEDGEQIESTETEGIETGKAEVEKGGKEKAAESDAAKGEDAAPAKEAKEETVIEDQTYKVDIVPHGSVKFVPYAPANEGSDVVFKIMKKDQVVTVLPSYYENNSLAATGTVFVDVEEVFFKDYNIDGVEDIFVNCVYKYSADSTDTFMECRIFRGSAEGDYYLQKSLSKVGTEQAQANGTIGYYVDELRDLYANYDLPYSNSISYAREELEMLTEEQLMKARNEIYARHGYWFENEDLWKHFSNRDWYQPYTYTVPDSALNEHEIHNRDLIIELEGR